MALLSIRIDEWLWEKNILLQRWSLTTIKDCSSFLGLLLGGMEPTVFQRSYSERRLSKCGGQPYFLMKELHEIFCGGLWLNPPDGDPWSQVADMLFLLENPIYKSEMQHSRYGEQVVLAIFKALKVSANNPGWKYGSLQSALGMPTTRYPLIQGSSGIRHGLG